MAHLQYMPGDPRLVDQLVYELKSKGIFDQFRKECIADVDTRPAYQNLRQRVENSVTTFLSHQCWKQDLNKNQLREKLRKHILDGNYLEQGVERIVDQVVNPKIASVFIPQVEDLVYNYLGITRKKSTTAPSETSVENPTADLLPTDLEAVSPGSVKSNEDKPDDVEMETKQEPMDVDQDIQETKIEESSSSSESEKEKEKPVVQGVISGACGSPGDSEISIDKSSIPLPEDMIPENIPPPDNSPPKLDLNKIELPKTPEEYAHLPQNPTEIPLPTDGPTENENSFKPINPNSDNDDSSSDSSLRRNMSPLTPVRNFNTENSCDAQQAFDTNSEGKTDEKKEPSSFRFAIESKPSELDSVDSNKKKKDSEQVSLEYQFNNQVNINTLNTPFYEDSSNSNNLQIDYESDANSKINVENKVNDAENSEDAKKERKSDDKKSSHKSSHRSRDSRRHSSSKDKKSNSKQSSSRDSSRHDKKPKDDHSKSKSSHKDGDRSKDKSDRKDSRDSSKHRSSHRGSSSQKDSKSNKSSSSSQRSSKQCDDKKSSSSHRDKSEKSSDKTRDKKDSKYGSHDSKSSSYRSEKDKKPGTKSKHDDKDKKRGKKDTDDHYSLSGRGNSNRRSTDRDSNDGSSSSKGSNNPTSSKSSESKKENKGSSSKSDNTSSSDSTSPSDKEHKVTNAGNDTKNVPTVKPIVRVETQLEVPIASPPRLPFVPDVTLKKPKFAANLEEAKKMMKMRKFLDEEQKRMNQEAALLLEFQANVRPSLSQAYSNISGPELEFACVTNLAQTAVENQVNYEIVHVSNPENQTGEFQDQTQDVIIEKDPSEAGNASNINDEIEGACLINENIDSRFVQTDLKGRIVEHCVLTNGTHSNSIDPNIDMNETDSDNQQGNDKRIETYEENKPFSQLVEEITEYSKASERMKLTEKPNTDVTETTNRSDLFEVTIITEEMSENEENEDTNIETQINQEVLKECPDEEFLHYFAEHEKYDAELKKHVYSSFLKKIYETLTSTKNMYLVNCDTYEENIFREVCQNFGQYEIVNYFKNGHLKLPTAMNVKNFDLDSEIALPVNKGYHAPLSKPAVFSPVKSECSFDLSNDYDAKLEEMVNKTSKQEVLEIILGGVIDESSNAMPTIDYCKESNIISEIPMKRKANDMEIPGNNNRHILTSNKIRKLSESDQISSTTEETDEASNNNKIPIHTRSKYLGKAKQVGLSRPRKPNHPNSPSSDKSVENYEQNSTPQTLNGKLKTPQRTKIQRYDTSDLYKPKLHYLSRRNNIS